MSLRNLQKAKYKSPSGQVVVFDYRNIESYVEKKTAVFESAVGNGTYVQDNGHTSGRFPMECYFHGDEYDLKADAFLSAVLERGEGVLTHPIFGDISVVPSGQITRIDPLVEAAGQVVYTVEFFETTGLLIGESGGLSQVFDSLVQASAVDFSEKLNLNDPFDKMSFKNRFLSAMKRISAVMKKASGAVSKVTEGIEDVGDSIERGIDTLLGDPLSLARQTQIMIGEPRRQNSLLTAKLNAYNDLAVDIFFGTLAEPSKYGKEAANTFHLNRLQAKSMLANMAMLSVESFEYKLKSDYILTAKRLSDILEQYQDWQDNNYASLETDSFENEYSDTVDGLEQLIALIHGACADLVKRSFGSRTEMREILPRDEALLPLCFRKYGTVDNDTVDNFIAINNLELDELFIIPRGREIVWHV